MDGFSKYLRKGDRSKSVVERCFNYVEEFSNFLVKYRDGKSLDKANSDDLELFVEWLEKESGKSAKVYLWGLWYYFDYTSNKDLRILASELREQRIKRKFFKLSKFRGVNPEYTTKLAAVGIVDVEQIRRAGKDVAGRLKLSERTGIPQRAILELVKLSDLARIGAVRAIRARLYYDAGIDTVEKMAQWDPEELREYLIDFVNKTGFDGLAPLPKETRNAVNAAKKLQKIVDY